MEPRSREALDAEIAIAECRFETALNHLEAAQNHLDIYGRDSGLARFSREQSAQSASLCRADFLRTKWLQLLQNRLLSFDVCVSGQEPSRELPIRDLFPHAGKTSACGRNRFELSDSRRYAPKLHFTLPRSRFPTVYESATGASTWIGQEFLRAQIIVGPYSVHGILEPAPFSVDCNKWQKNSQS